MINNTVTKSINEALVKVYAGGAVQEAVDNILGDPGIKAGTQVAVLSDPIHGMEGIKGRVKGATDRVSGMVDIELESGVVMPFFSNLLVAL